MNQSSPDAANSIDRNVGRKQIMAVALAIVFIMVATSFFTAVVNAEDEPPAIWTSQDEYAPEETVYLYGSGWIPLVPLTLTLSHSDLGVKTFYATPDSYGQFVFDDYVAEPVINVTEPVVVTALQVYLGGELSAVREFYDPAVST